MSDTRSSGPHNGGVVPRPLFGSFGQSGAQEDAVVSPPAEEGQHQPMHNLVLSNGGSFHQRDATGGHKSHDGISVMTSRSGSFSAFDGSQRGGEDGKAFSPTPSTNSTSSFGGPRTPCYYFLRGFCRNGESCRFVHDPSVAAMYAQNPAAFPAPRWNMNRGPRHPRAYQASSPGRPMSIYPIVANNGYNGAQMMQPVYIQYPYVAYPPNAGPPQPQQGVYPTYAFQGVAPTYPPMYTTASQPLITNGNVTPPQTKFAVIPAQQIPQSPTNVVQQLPPYPIVPRADVYQPASPVSPPMQNMMSTPRYPGLHIAGPQGPIPVPVAAASMPLASPVAVPVGVHTNGIAQGISSSKGSDGPTSPTVSSPKMQAQPPYKNHAGGEQVNGDGNPNGNGNGNAAHLDRLPAVCRYFSEGKPCWFADKCRFRHEL